MRFAKQKPGLRARCCGCASRGYRGRLPRINIYTVRQTFSGPRCAAPSPGHSEVPGPRGGRAIVGAQDRPRRSPLWTVVAPDPERNREALTVTLAKCEAAQVLSGQARGPRAGCAGRCFERITICRPKVVRPEASVWQGVALTLKNLRAPVSLTAAVTDRTFASAAECSSPGFSALGRGLAPRRSTSCR